MRSDLGGICSSPVATAVSLLALAVFLYAVLFGPAGESWGAPAGSPEWWLGVGCAALAVGLGVRSWLRAE